jgi:glutamate synthase (NADPH/NADH) large chain
MTGGTAVILGPVGRNFAAGMSGGVAYVFDPDEKLPEYINPGMVEILELDVEDEERLLEMVRMHMQTTGSAVARDIITDWSRSRRQFVRVISPTYRRILELRKDRDRLSEEVVRG